MTTISEQQLKDTCGFPQLIEALDQGFREDIQVPLRHHYDIPNPTAATDSTFLLMPAWQTGGFIGVKIITVAPENARLSLPSIQGAYLLFDATDGRPLANIEAKTLTNLRTAAASALASGYLSRTDASSLLMVGTGSLAPYLIRAHAAIRPIRKVSIWGRNPAKAAKLCHQFRGEKFEVNAAPDLLTALPEADIISVATLSSSPLIPGKLLRPGQHLDLVGSFKPNMREADDDCLTRSRVYVDTLEGATKESGDLVVPLKNGVITLPDIQGDLFDLCRGKVKGRETAQSITLFKSVGHALEDLVAARLAYNLL